MAHRTVQIYLSVRSDEGASPKAVPIFMIRYRRPIGVGSVTGQDGHAVIQDLPANADTLSVERVECVGYVTKRQQDKAPHPWVYPINTTGDGGDITIEMVESKPDQDPPPEPRQVLDMVREKGLSVGQVTGPAEHDKHKVSLRIENATDRPIDFLAYDCANALGSEADIQGAKLWTGMKDSRRIQPGATVIWANFDAFRAPSGWFALFVRYDDPGASRIAQKQLGVYNLFKIREPKIVIERDTASNGVGFKVSNEKSLLGN